MVHVMSTLDRDRAAGVGAGLDGRPAVTRRSHPDGGSATAVLTAPLAGREAAGPLVLVAWSAAALVAPERR
jgi:hypothetical protein